MLTRYRLLKIKQSIVTEDKLICKTLHKIIKLPKDSYEHINCYAYALGIMEPSRTREYIPGFTVNSNYKEYSKSDLIFKICKDLEKFGISYRKFGVYDSIHLRKGEYLIQVLYIPEGSALWPETDFHFLRKSKEEIWFSKPGWLNQPITSEVETILSFGNEELVRVHFNGFSRDYFRVAYFAIKEK